MLKKSQDKICRNLSAKLFPTGSSPRILFVCCGCQAIELPQAALYKLNRQIIVKTKKSDAIQPFARGRGTTATKRTQGAKTKTYTSLAGAVAATRVSRYTYTVTYAHTSTIIAGRLCQGGVADSVKEASP